MRNTKDSTLEEPLIHPSIWIRNDAIMNEEDNEAEGSRISLPTKQINIRKNAYIIAYKQRRMKTCSKEQVTTFQNNMTSAVTSLMENLPDTKKKGKTSSRRMMSRM